MDIREDSTEYATATVTTDHDITGQTIEVGLPSTGGAVATWFAADVVGTADLGTGKWRTTYRLLIGPAGTATLGKGTYDWLVKITDTPEVPVRKAGTVKVL